jgi:hypothetical protein
MGQAGLLRPWPEEGAEADGERQDGVILCPGLLKADLPTVVVSTSAKRCGKEAGVIG